MSALKLRADAILPFTPATDLSEKRGHSVTLAGDTATISASASVKAAGIILEGADTDGHVMVGILGALSGTVPAKLAGAVTKGDNLVQHTDGRWVTDPAAGARVLSLVALESGVEDDLIEAAPQTPQVLA